MKKEKKTKLSFYMMKKGVSDFKEAYAQNSQGVETCLISGNRFLVFKNSKQYKPKWLNTFFKNTLDGLNIFNASTQILLLFKAGEADDERIFAVTFGQGRHLLNENQIEERFGLKIALSALKEADGFRSVDITTFATNPKKSREQIGRLGEIENFQLDFDQDMINSVTGSSSEMDFGLLVTGRDAFSSTVAVTLENVEEFAAKLYSVFSSNKYQSRFPWVDHIEIAGPREAAALDNLLVEKLSIRNIEKIWLSVPEVLEWEQVKGFRYAGSSVSTEFSDLLIRDFLDVFEIQSITVDFLRKNKIYLISNIDDSTIKKWSIYKCIYAELNIGEDLYFLNEGKWYKIQFEFVKKIEENYEAIENFGVEFPECDKGLIERDYNLILASSLPNSINMDARNIVHGGGRSSIEFCDIYLTSKVLIHVKNYGASSVLSHLFLQGMNSGILFLSDEDFRRKLNLAEPRIFHGLDAKLKPIASDYKIVFAIISESENELNIPFFSKVSLSSVKRDLSGYGYDVYKKKIQRKRN